MPPSRPRAPRLDPDARRRSILDAALAEAAAEDFASLTVDAVARRAGITRPVVYDLFGSFAGLLQALLDDVEARALAAIDAGLPDLTGDPDPAEVFEAAIRTFMGEVRREPALWRVVLAPAEGTPAEVRERYRTRRGEVVDHLAGLLGWWARRVGAPEAIDLPVLARTMVAVFEDATRLALQHPRKYPPERLARGAADFARLVPLVR